MPLVWHYVYFGCFVILIQNLGFLNFAIHRLLQEAGSTVLPEYEVLLSLKYEEVDRRRDRAGQQGVG